MAGDALIDVQRRETRDFREPRDQHLGATLTAIHRFGKALELGEQDRALPLGHPKVLARQVMLVPATVGHPADIVERPGQTIEIAVRSEEHTSELQSRENLVCRLPPE